MANVSRDSGSNVYAPSNADQWTTTMSQAALTTGNPTSTWLCQEASGNLADSIGSFTLTANATPLYRQAVAGWSRLAVGTDDGAGNEGFMSTDAGLPDPATTSYLILAYVALLAVPAANRGVMIFANVPVIEARYTTTPRYMIVNSTGTAGTSNPGSAVRPVVIRSNQTADTNLLATDQEKITELWSSPAGRRVALGGFDAAAPSALYLYAAMFTGAAAELTDAQLKTLLQTLGWSIAWS